MRLNVGDAMLMHPGILTGPVAFLAVAGSRALSGGVPVQAAGGLLRFNPNQMRPVTSAAAPNTASSGSHPEKSMAVRQGFEPWEPVKVQRFSRPPHSTALPPHRTSFILPEPPPNSPGSLPGRTGTVTPPPTHAEWPTRPPAGPFCGIPAHFPAGRTPAAAAPAVRRSIPRSPAMHTDRHPPLETHRSSQTAAPLPSPRPDRQHESD